MTKSTPRRARSTREYRKPRLVVYGDLSALTRETSGGSENPDGVKIGGIVFRTS